MPMGACLVEGVERYYASMKPSQSYYGAFEEIEDKMGGGLPREYTYGSQSTYVNREVEDREQKLAKLEKDIELKERENTLIAKQMKLENKVSEKPDICSYLLEHFNDELTALQSTKPGFQ